MAEKGYDPTFGARPLRRVIEQKIEDPLSDEVLSGAYLPGSTIQVELNKDDDELIITRRADADVDADADTAFEGRRHHFRATSTPLSSDVNVVFVRRRHRTRCSVSVSSK